MRNLVLLPCCVGLVLLLAACTQSEQKKVDQEAAKTKQEVQQAGSELKNELKSTGVKTSTADAGQKLDHAGEVAKHDAAVAGEKLDHAALIAQIKAKLASDVGLRAASSVSVDTSGHTVTLRGSVPSAEQKQQAERVAAQVDGVHQVINELTVE